MRRNHRLFWPSIPFRVCRSIQPEDIDYFERVLAIVVDPKSIAYVDGCEIDYKRKVLMKDLNSIILKKKRDVDVENHSHIDVHSVQTMI